MEHQEDPEENRPISSAEELYIKQELHGNTDDPDMSETYLTHNDVTSAQPELSPPAQTDDTSVSPALLFPNMFHVINQAQMQNVSTKDEQPSCSSETEVLARESTNSSVGVITVDKVNVTRAGGGKKQHQCTECDRSFFKLSKFTEHVRTHT